MLTWFVTRTLQSLCILLGITLFVFIGLHLIGNPVDLYIAEDATPAERAALIQQMGFDQPLWHQYQQFVLGLLQGKMDKSYVGHLDPFALIFEKLPATIELAVAALLLALLIGIPAGLLLGLKPQHWAAKVLQSISMIGFSMPTFLVGVLLVYYLSTVLGWFPSTSRGETRSLWGVEWSFLTLNGWKHLFLPALTLAFFQSSFIIRFVKNSVEEIKTQEYIRFAQAKGLSPTRIIFYHIFYATLLPLITVMGLEFGSTLAYSVVTESVFAWPGTGSLILQAILNINRPVVVSYLMCVAVLFILINWVVDLLYYLLDPRLRLGRVR